MRRAKGDWSVNCPPTILISRTRAPSHARRTLEFGDLAVCNQVVEVAKSAGIDAAALAAALADPAVKERAKAEVDAALARGVFGSPYFIVDGESFWGTDRIPMLEDWVKRGGW